MLVSGFILIQFSSLLLSLTIIEVSYIYVGMCYPQPSRVSGLPSLSSDIIEGEGLLLAFRPVPKVVESQKYDQYSRLSSPKVPPHS